MLAPLPALLPSSDTFSSLHRSCMSYLRQFMNAWRDNAATTRIFFPDNQELAIARSGQTLDPAAGRYAAVHMRTAWMYNAQRTY